MLLSVCAPCLLSPSAAQGLLRQSNTAKAFGALLSELCQLSHMQLQLWWYAQDPAQQQDTPVSHAAAVLQLLRQCCSDLQAADMPELLPGQDAVAVLIAWVLGVLRSETSSAQRHSSRHGRPKQRPGQDAAQEQQGQQEQQRQHPAESLRQLLDVLLSALMYRHALVKKEWVAPRLGVWGGKGISGLGRHGRDYPYRATSPSLVSLARSPCKVPPRLKQAA